MDAKARRSTAVRERATATGAPTDSSTNPPTDPPTEIPPSTTTGSAGGLVRVTVNLTPKSADSLEAISGTTGLSKTDVINRALQVYKVVEELLDRGGGSILIKHPNGELERVYIV
jgi:hypothetical protein